MPDELRSAIEREAFVHGRAVTAEINMRLKESFKQMPASYSAVAHTGHGTAHLSNDVIPGDQQLPDTERAMLDVFRRLPPEKQLALLSLFK